MNNISEIRNTCVGCRSCEQRCPQSCIVVQPDQEGFLYPQVNEENCVQCGICLKSCPTEHMEYHRSTPTAVNAVRNKNDADIMYSASGGAADIAAKVILQQGGMVYGAAYDKKFAVRHIEITMEEERRKIQSSKYVQSDTGNCYQIVESRLSSGKKVLFIGTPCQIAGLYSYLGEDSLNLYTLDLICHGVPSPKFFEKYLIWQNKKMKGKLVYYNFRSKEQRGWGTQYMLKTKKRIKTKKLSLDPYGKNFMKGNCYRESCYQCPWASMKRIGDLTVGDFWGILKSHPDFYSKKGVSSVFINTNKGKEMFELMKEYAYIQETTLEEGMDKQGNLIKPMERPKLRNDFYKNIDDGNFMDGLRVGLQIKERIKSVIPLEFLVVLKRKMG